MSVFIISVENLRKDFMGCYGGKVETEFMDIFQQDAIIFNKHYPNSFNMFANTDCFLKSKFHYKINRKDKAIYHDFDLKPQALFLMSKETNKTQKKYINKLFKDTRVDYINYPGRDLATYLSKIAKKNMFIYIHIGIMNPKDMVGTYEEALIKIDKFFGKMMAALERKDLYDKSLIILRSPSTMNFPPEEDITVPMMFKPPCDWIKDEHQGYHKNRVESISRDIDIMPTIMEMIGVNGSKQTDGVSLVSAIYGKNQGLMNLVCDNKKKMLIDSFGDFV